MLNWRQESRHDNFLKIWLAGPVFAPFLATRLRASFRLPLTDLHFRMRLWRRVKGTEQRLVAAARGFFVVSEVLRFGIAHHD
jgi:hypothetical protein